MTTRSYDVPLTDDATYASMRSTMPVYRASQIRSPLRSRPYTRAIKSRLSLRGTKNMDVYMCFIVLLLAIILACTCYLIISVELLKYNKQGTTTKTCNRDDKDDVQILNQINSKIDTIMHSLYYNLPHALTSVSNQVSNKLDFIDYDFKNSLKQGFLDLQLNLGSNKTFRITTGNRGKDINQPPHSGIPTDKTTRYVVPTLVPKVRYGTGDIPGFPIVAANSRLVDPETNLNSIRDKNFKKRGRMLSYNRPG
ncbi:transmembrane protein [Meliandou mastomys virus]|uniref:Transmembrane protein n=1 Tax=Meliandou mastomys virus TaxID=2940987 RepID=A0AAE9HT94_9MONO|nr:transmembrane protein [Meliandou mastomys virus]